MTYWKVTTHDLRPPLQGGDPIWDGATPYRLLTVPVDRSDAHCGAGWNACRDAATALRIAGLWRHGRPARLWLLSCPDDLVERGDKVRAASWTIEREATHGELCAAIERLHEPVERVAHGVTEQVMAWRRALGRPRRDEAAVEAGLRAALEARGLGGWTLTRYATAQAVWDARAAWGAWGARDAWGAWDAEDARAVWDARAAWGAWDASGAWDAEDARAVWDARAAWGAGDARAALAVYSVRAAGWLTGDPLVLTIGLRDAYAAGLGVARPVAPNVLGWTMDGDEGS